MAQTRPDSAHPPVEELSVPAWVYPYRLGASGGALGGLGGCASGSGPGTTLNVDAPEAGTYQIVCGTPNHIEMGMLGTMTVVK